MKTVDVENVGKSIDNLVSKIHLFIIIVIGNFIIDTKICNINSDVP